MTANTPAPADLMKTVAEAIGRVCLFSRFNNWTDDRVEGLPIEICRYDDETGDPVVIARYPGEEGSAGEGKHLARHLNEERAKSAIAAYRSHMAGDRVVLIEAAANYVLDNSRRGTSLNAEQRDADDEALMKAYRDIIGKAFAYAAVAGKDAEIARLHLELHRIKRAAELSAGIMRDIRRTDGWEGGRESGTSFRRIS